MAISEEDLTAYRENLKRARLGRLLPVHPGAAEGKVLKSGADLKPPPKPSRSRFARSKPADRTLDGVTYASKGEMKFAKKLALEWLKNPAMWWMRQPVFDLAGVRYTADFLVVRAKQFEFKDGSTFPRMTVTVYEIKPKLKPGRFRDEALRTFRRNAAQVNALWGVHVELVEI